MRGLALSEINMYVKIYSYLIYIIPSHPKENFTKTIGIQNRFFFT